MKSNPVISMLGRRLRLAVIGGGPGSFIGAMHRQSARFDDRFEIVAGVLSSKPERARKAGLDLGLAADRVYTDVIDMLDAEMQRADGVDAVAIMTPNDSHYPYSMAALERGFDVICDKPMTNTLEDAEKLHQKVVDSGLVFALTHNYTGYPVVRQAKAMVMAGEVGEIRMVQVEYVQGGRADESVPNNDADWHYYPEKKRAVPGDGRYWFPRAQPAALCDWAGSGRSGCGSGPCCAGSPRGRFRRGIAAHEQWCAGYVFCHSGGGGSGEQPGLPGMRHKRQPGMDAGTAPGADLQTAGTAGADAHAQRTGQPAPGETFLPRCGRPSGRIP